MEWYLKVLKNYAQFEGRAHRKEYWMFVLFNFLISFVLAIIAPELLYLYNLGVLIPGLAVGVRRLHDTGRSGWWLLISFIPLVGAVILLVYFLQDSESGANKYGPSVKENSPEAASASLAAGTAETDTSKTDTSAAETSRERESKKETRARQQPEVNYCSNCGEKVSSGDSYCKNCGQKI